jgi:cytochrome P450
MTLMRSAGSSPAGSYDPFTREALADPAAAHRYLRERCPVHHFDGFGERGFYTVSRHADVDRLFRDVGLWSSEWGQGPIYSREGGLRSDPPEHTIYRRLVTGAFSARRVAALDPVVQEVAGSLVGALAGKGEADLIAEFATPLPVIMISRILGVPPERRDDFKRWSDEFMAGQNAADPAVQAAARAKIDAYFGAELDRRRALHRDGAALPDDVLTSLLSAEHDGRRFTNEQLLPLILLLLVGGNETTTSLIGNLVWRLLDLGLWEQVSARPQLRDAAIEESLRYDPPVLGLFRTSTRPTSLHGVEIPPDSKVHGLYASANRDPAAWDDPDTFRLDRDYDDLRRRHLSFGVGLYLCPGAALARREARVALDLLIGRLPGLRLTDQPERTDSFMMWGPKSLRVAWDVPVPGSDS